MSYRHWRDPAIVTRKEVAKLAGVSEATVSRVFNDVGPIREETKRRVMQAAQELNYYPNAIAQSFARKRSGNIGVVVPFVPKVHLFSTYYFSEILSGIGEQVNALGYDVLLLFRRMDESLDYSQSFQSQKIDSCIILGSRDVPEERAALERLAAAGHPFCLINQRFDGLPFNGVDADHIQGSRDAVAHLVAQGISRILFLNGQHVYSNSVDRAEGYRQALAEAGIDFRPGWIVAGNYSRKSGYEAADQVAKLVRDEGVQAIIAGNDRMAIGLFHRLNELGLAAGRDYALVGCDNSDAATLLSPPLSSVMVPFYEMGKLASEQLIGQMASGAHEVPFEIKCKTELIVRASSIWQP